MLRWMPFVIRPKSKPWTDESRRRCLNQAAISAGTAPLASSLGAAVGAATAAAVTLGAHAQGADDASNPGAAPSGAKGYQSSSPDEAAFVEALVNVRSEEHTSELQSLMRISYAVFCLKKKKHRKTNHQ